MVNSGTVLMPGGVRDLLPGNNTNRVDIGPTSYQGTLIFAIVII